MFKDYLDQSNDELVKLLMEQKKKLFESRQDIAAGGLSSDTSKAKKIRKIIARINTAINLKKNIKDRSAS